MKIMYASNNFKPAIGTSSIAINISLLQRRWKYPRRVYSMRRLYHKLGIISGMRNMVSKVSRLFRKWNHFMHALSVFEWHFILLDAFLFPSLPVSHKADWILQAWISAFPTKWVVVDVTSLSRTYRVETGTACLSRPATWKPSYFPGIKTRSSNGIGFWIKCTQRWNSSLRFDRWAFVIRYIYC